jgi:hypothetical protein
MGLDRVLPIVTAEESVGDVAWIELESDSAGPAFKRTVVEAHQQLADLPGPAGNTFRDLAALLTEEWQADEARRASVGK